MSESLRKSGTQEVQAGLALAHTLREIFASRKIVFQDEIDLQNLIAGFLADKGITFVREFELTSSDRIDFFIFESGVGIEVKTQGGLHPVLRQLKRYSEHPVIKELILISPKPWQLPSTLTGKPIHGVSFFASLI